MERLLTIPGVNVITAWTIIAELGLDMRQFPDADHAASWAGLVPGSYESAGKRKSTRTRHGNRWLRRGLCQSAWAVSRKKDCYLTAVFYRRASRHGVKKAIVATAHQLLIIAFHLLRDGGVYRELGGEFFDQLNPERTRKRLTQRLERLGYEVVLTPAKAASRACSGAAARASLQVRRARIGCVPINRKKSRVSKQQTQICQCHNVRSFEDLPIAYGHNGV